jgi:putative FmdB family regulatory protein
VPTYEYECDKCRRVFEIRQRITEPALTTCDVCGGAVRRLLSPAPFILKGDGWYVTDYPSESRKKAIEAEKSSSTSTPASSDKAAAPKSEGKAETSSSAPAASASKASEPSTS